MFPRLRWYQWSREGKTDQCIMGCNRIGHKLVVEWKKRGIGLPAQASGEVLRLENGNGKQKKEEGGPKEVMKQTLEMYLKCLRDIQVVITFGDWMYGSDTLNRSLGWREVFESH